MAFKRSRTVLKTFTLKSYHISPIPKMAAVEIRTWGTSTFFMVQEADIILIPNIQSKCFTPLGCVAQTGCGSVRAGSGASLLNAALSSLCL